MLINGAHRSTQEDFVNVKSKVDAAANEIRCDNDDRRANRTSQHLLLQLIFARALNQRTARLNKTP